MTNSVSNAGLSTIAAAADMGDVGGKASNWFEAFASAWGKALDKQADVITTQSDQLADGGDRPSDITKLSAESMRMSFMANSSHTSLDSVSKALETMARKG
jgi:prolyl-tRNA synthetase